MSTYEDDHNISTPRARNRTNHGRQHQTLSSAINNFLTQDTSASSSNPETMLSALRSMESEEGSNLAGQLVEILSQNFDGSGFDDKAGKGIDQDFLDTLERVKISDVPNKETADCSICTNRFVDDEYPLIVRLPCDAQTIVSGKKIKGHIFDLECIGPWLKVNATCPLCRFDVAGAEKKRKEKLEEELRKAKEEDDEEEDEDWDIYG